MNVFPFCVRALIDGLFSAVEFEREDLDELTEELISVRLFEFVSALYFLIQSTGEV